MLFDTLKTISERLVAFRNDEDGAVTVDFVVLTSAVMLMGGAHVADVASGVNDIGSAIDVCLATDLANVVDGDPATYVQNLQTAAQACSSR